MSGSSIESVLPVRGQLAIVTTKVQTTTEQIGDLRQLVVGRLDELKRGIDDLKLAQANQGDEIAELQKQLTDLQGQIG